MRQVLVMGQANVGKSVIFNRLVGGSAFESNYPGVTVDFLKGRMVLDGEKVEVIDVPGTFSLEPKDKAEEVAVRILDQGKDVMVVCILDSSKVGRGLYLVLEIIERGYPVVIALNMSDVAENGKIKIDEEKLEQILDVPVVSMVATKGEGLEELMLRMKKVVPGEIEKIMEKAGGGNGTHN